MRDVTWEWIGSSKPGYLGGIAVFSVGAEKLELEFCRFRDAGSVYQLLREAYLLGKETGVHEVCVAVRRACNENCLD